MEGTARKWQPVVVVTDRRLECKCGALAIFITGRHGSADEYNILEEVDVWCQDCFAAEQEREEEEGEEA